MYRLLPPMLSLLMATTSASAQASRLDETQEVLEWVQAAAEYCDGFSFNDDRAIEMIRIAYESPAGNATKSSNESLAALIPPPPGFRVAPQIDCELYLYEYGPAGAVFPGLILLESD